MLIDLAIALLEDANDSLETYTHTLTKPYVLSSRIDLHWWMARARHLRGDHAAAIRRAEEVLALLKGVETETWEDAATFKRQHEARFAADVEKYKKAAEPPKGK